ncbi:ZBTB9 protein, partial [Xiphorhynchus elegans]|nr:ZBTB9 protein [Xiphorhynchus elegans]
PEPGRVQISFPRHAAALLDSLNRLRLEGKFCDVTVHVGGRVFPAHKSVLAAASPFFHDKLLLQDGGHLALPPAIDAAAFEGLLQLIYSGCLMVALEALPGHLLAASGLQMWHVVDRCSEILRGAEGAAGGGGRRSVVARGVRGHEGSSSSSASSVATRPSGSELLQIHVATGASPSSPFPPEPLLKAPDGEEILKICVEDDEDDEEEDDEGPASTDALRIVLEDTDAAAPRDPPKIFYIKQELANDAAGAAPALLVPPLPFPTAPNPSQGALLCPQPSWKPVDLHGNEISGRAGALHAPVKLGAAPADGKRFGCACGKRFAVKPKRDRHIMLTLSLRPFACATCHK